MQMSRFFCTLVLLLSVFLMYLPASASSHREAPFITEHPKVDGTDLYMFNSYESGRSDFVTIIANYLPLQDAYGGPNYFTLDPQALYEIHIDNNGDAKEDLTFQFQFMNSLEDIALDIGPQGQTKKVSVPVINVGSVGPTSRDIGSLNVRETYTVKLVKGNRRAGMAQFVSDADTNATTFVKPVDNIGKKSISDYETYARNHIYNVSIPDCDKTGKMFVGQRKEPFVVNLGETFDLVNIKEPIGKPEAEANTIDDKNITSLVLEIPRSCLVKGNGTIIGGWTTASLPKLSALSPKPTFDKPSQDRGPYVQVSRLANPLVNELVIGIKDKDKFNASEPKDDKQFADYVTNPTLPAILELLFGSAGVKAPTAFPRTDLVSVFLSGVDGINKTTPALGEVMRLNTNVPAVAAKDQKTLGVIGGDNAGYPNGRRLGDDVVDISLRVVMGKLLPASQAPSGQLEFTDGAKVGAKDFNEVFPYLKSPIPGSPNGVND